MILDRYIFKELFYTLFGVFSILTVVMISQQLVRYLSDAAAGKLPVDLVLSMLGFKTLNVVTLVLPLSLFVAIIIGLGRLYKDSEMVVMSACGVSPARVLMAVSGLAVPIALLLIYLALYVAPWASEQESRILDRAAAKTDFTGLTAGRFLQAGGAENVYYVERLSADRKRAYGIFVQIGDKDSPMLLSAAEGHQIIEPGTKNRFLVAENGYRYDGVPGEEGFRIVDYRAHGVRIQTHEPPRGRRKMRTVPTAKLIGSHKLRDIAELQWRWSIPLQALLLALLAAPLSHTDPRQGRFARVFAAILAYLIYSNLLTGARAWLEQGTLPPSLGLWWPHGLMLSAILLLLAAQSRVLYRMGRRLAPGRTHTGAQLKPEVEH